MKKIKNWTDEQIDYLINNYHNYTVKELAEHIGKSPNAVGSIAKSFGLGKQCHKPWSDNEIEYIKNNYFNMTAEDMAEYLHRSVVSVRGQIQRLNLCKEPDWNDEDIEFLINNYSNMSYIDIGKKLGRTDGSIRAKCFDLNLVKNDRWDIEDEELLKRIYYRIPTKDIAKLMNRTPNAIQIKAMKLGLKKYPYYCNYNFFKNIDTEDKAYWLGFLSADGWINKNEETCSGVVGVEIQYKDINHLKKLNKSLEGNYKITDRWRTCSLSPNPDKQNHMCCLRIFSLDMYNDLVDKGFSKDKSYSFSIPDIPEEFMRDFMRGYFDGDGCFGISISNKEVKNYSCSYVSASKKIIKEFEAVIHNIGIVSTRIDSYQKEGCARIWRLFINDGNNYGRIKFLDYLYKDANIYLDRKYERYKMVKNYIESRLPHQTEMSGSFIL